LLIDAFSSIIGEHHRARFGQEMNNQHSAFSIQQLL